MQSNLQKITTNLWFDNEAEEAATYYTSIFKDSSIGRIARYGKEGYEIHKRPAGSVMTVEFELNGHSFIGLNGGPVFNFSEAVSFVVNCKDQEELDYYWDKLKEGGDPKAQECGWLKDKYGVSWQIVPTMMAELYTGEPDERTERMMAAMLKMKKLDIKTLQDAYNGKS